MLFKMGILQKQNLQIWEFQSQQGLGTSLDFLLLHHKIWGMNALRGVGEVLRASEKKENILGLAEERLSQCLNIWENWH